jgi:DNA polymerase-3 subunit epsilon
MRQLILDTETTGLNARTGDRVIEIGCVELVNRRLTGSNLHFYINPERDSDPGALAVHGLTTEFLSDKPKFAEIANELRDFVQGADLIIHNAPFDIGFLDAEFALLGLPPFSSHCGEVIDTLVRAKAMFPGKRNSLDALCDRFGISNAHRTLHGALLDSELQQRRTCAARGAEFARVAGDRCKRRGTCRASGGARWPRQGGQGDERLASPARVDSG